MSTHGAEKPSKGETSSLLPRTGTTGLINIQPNNHQDLALPAPKRFKSSYICFSVAHQDEVKEELAKLGKGCRVSEISKRMAEKWKALSSEERKIWEDEAKADRARYDEERSNYMGPMQVPNKRRKKDPNAPKRPMSAFLFFSQKYRAKVKLEEPDLKNTDVSKRLGEMWRGASEEERNYYIEEEARLRAQYKVDMVEWKKQDAKDRAEARKRERDARKTEKAREKKEEKQRAKEEARTTAATMGITAGGDVRGRDDYASRPTPREVHGAYYGDAGGPGGGAYDSFEGQAGPGPIYENTVYASIETPYQGAAGLGLMGRSPYLRAMYDSLDAMEAAAMGAGTLGMGGLGQSSYSHGPGGYGGGLYSSALSRGVGLGMALERLQRLEDASIYGRFPAHGSPPSAMAAQQMMDLYGTGGVGGGERGVSGGAGKDG